jgi:flagellin
MAQVINTNIMSLTAQRNLSKTNKAMETAMQRLSSGLRINSAKDDAAGLAVSQTMLGQIKSYNQAVRNANDGISMIQTAESAMAEIQTMMQRVRELATQGASDTIGDAERGYLGDEMLELKEEMLNIANRTTFNGQYLMNGSMGSGVDTGASTVAVGMAVTSAAGDGSITNITVSGTDPSTTYSFTAGGVATEVLTLTNDTTGVGQAIDLSVALGPGDLAAGDSYTIDFAAIGVEITVTNAASAGGVITAEEIGAHFDTEDLVTTADSGAILQVGAGTTAADKLDINFTDVRVDEGTGTDADLIAFATAITTFATDKTRDTAESLLGTVDAALDAVSKQRGVLGAAQNRLDYTISGLQTASENLSAARSRVVDADFAAETAELTRVQILQQAGISMLAQANAAPQNVLALLQ